MELPCVDLWLHSTSDPLAFNLIFKLSRVYEYMMSSFPSISVMEKSHLSLEATLERFEANFG